MKKLIALAGVSVAAAAALAQIDPNKTILVVNGEEIKATEYYTRMEYLEGVGRQGPTGSFAEFPPGFLTIEQIVTDRLVLQLAKNKNVFPTDPEVAAELAKQTKLQPNLEANWAATGRTREDLMRRIRVQLAHFKLATRGVTVTDQEVKAHYDMYPGMYTVPKSYKLRGIVVLSEADRNAVDADLKAGKKFEDVAKARSAHFTKVNGGEFGDTPEAALSEQAANALKNVKIGSATEWIVSTGEGQSTYVKFLVEGITPQKLQPLDDNLKTQIRHHLMLIQGATKNNVQSDLNELRKTAKIDIKNKEFAEAYKRFVETFLGPGG